MFKYIRTILKRILSIPPIGVNVNKRHIAIYRPRLIENGRFIKIGEGTVIREHGWLSTIPEYGGVEYQPSLRIGKDVYIGRYACITCLNEVTIGDNCVLSEHVYIADSSHGIDPEAGHIMKQRLETKGPVSIGEGTFIGYGARVVSGTTLGRHCVVGANSVVTRSFPDYTMLAGIPARAIKTYNRNTRLWETVK